MIVHAQMLSADKDLWSDMKVPRQQNAMPVRGERPLIETVAEFAERLKKAELIGEYRAFLATGEVWRITVERRDQYVTKTRQELPV